MKTFSIIRIYTSPNAAVIPPAVAAEIVPPTSEPAPGII
jgi:hypothetical protein